MHPAPGAPLPPPRPSPDFLAGVIEGFYGPPWSTRERLELLDRLPGWGLNTYFYGPKDDLHNRALWRQPYDDLQAADLRAFFIACRQRRIHALYALSPGLDIRYSDATDFLALQRRVDQMLDLGASHFALLFDDIPDRLDAADLSRWGHLALAQAEIANRLFDWTRARCPEVRFFFCPTPYCGRMAQAGLGGPDYLALLGRELALEIPIFWTGPEIISREITEAHLVQVRSLLRRSPILWDNLHANDYDGRRFFCGPYSGRPLAIREHLAGILSNPNVEFPLNPIPLRTLGAFLQARETWDPRRAYLDAMRDWAAEFAPCTAAPPVDLQDLILLGDCYYLPHEDGPEAASLLADLSTLLQRPPASWGAEVDRLRQRLIRLRDTCGRMAELRHRALFHALSRRVWELREEMDLLQKYLELRQQHPDPETPVGSDFHLPGTYRGSLVARLQSLLHLQPDGSFLPAPPPHLPTASTTPSPLRSAPPR